jgi:hypothetical protein
MANLNELRRYVCILWMSWSCVRLGLTLVYNRVGDNDEINNLTRYEPYLLYRQIDHNSKIGIAKFDETSRK